MSSPFYPVRRFLWQQNAYQRSKQLLIASIGCFFMAGCIFAISRDGSPIHYLALGIAFFALFLMGCYGFLGFYRKDMFYDHYRVTGIEARIYGAFIMICGWGLILMFLFFRL